VPIGVNKDGSANTNAAFINGSQVDRWGLGVVQEIDSAAMHVFARWQHLSADINATDGRLCNTGVATSAGCRIFISPTDTVGTPGQANKHFGKGLNTSFEDLDIFQVGGVIFF
jgi:hypothetical protein